MIPGIILAMPEGSKWRGYNHRLNTDIGEITVIAHRRSGIEVYIAAVERVMTLPYPANNAWKLDGDHIRIGDPVSGQLTATYAPA